MPASSPYGTLTMPRVPHFRYANIKNYRRATLPTSSRAFHKPQSRSYSTITVLLIAFPFILLFVSMLDFRVQVVDPPADFPRDASKPLHRQQHPPYSAATDLAQLPRTPIQHNSPDLPGNSIHTPQKPVHPVSVPATTTTSTTTSTTTTTTAAPTSSRTTAATTTTTTTASTSTTTTTTTTTAAASTSAASKAASVPKPAAKQPQIKLTLIRDEPEPISGLDEIPSDNPPPFNGVPPKSLPSGHSLSPLLQKIRDQTQMTPRWPQYTRTQGPMLKTYGPAFSSILISHKLKVVYIPVFKVATTSMMWNIAYLEANPYIMEAHRQLDEGDLMQVLHDMSSPAWEGHTVYEFMAPQIREVFDNPEYLKFGFVRNPYDRIVSAYVDKVKRPEIESEEYQDQMYSLYGFNKEVRARVNVTRPTFREFLGAVKQVMSEPRVPTADLRYMEAYETNLCRRDVHWRPQVELLHPDLIHLDFVGHFDQMAKDREVVIEWMERHTDRKLPKEDTGRLHGTDPSHKKELFEALRKDEELRQLLLTIYKQDFERFHFSKEVPKGK